MRKIYLAVFSLGVIGFASACGSRGDVQEIAYRGSSSDTEVAPRDAGTIPQGTADSGDEVIMPSSPSAPAVPAAEETPPAAEPAPPAGPETPAIAEGEGVPDTTPEIGTPPLPPAVSCDEPAFAFVSNRSGVQNIFVHKAGSPRSLTDLRGVALSDLTVHPTRNELVFTELALFFPITVSLDLEGPVAAPDVVFDADADGGADSLTASAVFSPDGGNMAYVNWHNVGRKLVPEVFLKNENRAIVANADGRKEFRGIAWAGGKVIVSIDTKDDGAEAQLAIFDTARGSLYGLVDMTTITPAAGTSPAASPDGKSIAFVKKDSFGADQIYRCNLDQEPFGMGTLGSRGEITVCRVVAPLTSGSVNNQPAWSRDGRWIYFVSSRDGNKEIYRVRPDGTGEERLTNDPAEDTSPAPFAPYASCE
ncbi:MAG TPA: hypothetical protein VLJ37_09570 [bacterium]|nr:hypothetical protein [bacterium]